MKKFFKYRRLHNRGDHVGRFDCTMYYQGDSLLYHAVLYILPRRPDIVYTIMKMHVVYTAEKTSVENTAKKTQFCTLAR